MRSWYSSNESALAELSKMQAELTDEREKAHELERRLKSTDTQLQAERRLVKALMAELPARTLTTILAKASQELLAS